MKRIAWVTDSTAHLDEELLVNDDVFVIPLCISLDGKQYADGVDLTTTQLFEKLPKLKTTPTTSQPSIGVFQDLYEKLAEKYDMIVSVHISSKLSGTYSSSVQASQLVEIPVVPIDSKLISFPMSMLIKEGMKLHSERKNMEQIKSHLEMLIKSCQSHILIGSLEQLHRSGRLSGLQFFLGSMLNVKPIITFEDGALKIKEKIRSEKRAKLRIIKHLKHAYERHKIKEVYLLYGLHEKDALTWKKEMKKIFPQITYYCYPLCSAIGIHTGENTLGVAWFNGLE